MKVIACNPDGGAFKYILTSIGRAFTASGADFSHIQSPNVPSEFDLYLGCSGWRQNIPSKRTGLVGIHVNPYGHKQVGSVDGGPVIDEPRTIVDWTLKQNPDFVYCYCSESFVMDYYGYYFTKHKIPIVPMPTAADILIYKPQQPEQRFKCDIGWVGGYWPYKAKMLDIYIKPLINKHKCQIYGWGGWNNNKIITDIDVPKLFSSAAICPSVSESHTRIHPVDVPERLFKVPASGGFTIHSPTPAIRDLFGDELPVAKDQTHWFNLINHYLNSPNERHDLARRQRNTIMQKHTYFDRILSMASVISKLNSTWESFKQNIITAKNKAMV